MTTRPLIEILYFDGCPNVDATRALVERVGDELGVEPDVELVEVSDVAEAERLRFLGSPTVRVDGSDVEPGADERVGAAFSCRIYRTGRGLFGSPDEAWIRDALERASHDRG